MDVDTGTDDALAIIYLMKAAPDRLVGITTAVGNVSCEQATVNTLKVLELVGSPHRVPVVQGAEQPLVRAWPGTKVSFHGYNGLADYVLPNPAQQPAAGHAASFIIEAANRYAGELSLIFTGRLTNLALALRQDPELPAKIGKLVIMGGALRVPGNITPYAESNIYGDPEAADIVFRAGFPLVMVGLDVTEKALLRREHTALLLERLLRQEERLAAFLEHLLDYRSRAFLGKRGIDASPLHDPLAAALALRPELAVFEEVKVTIETEDTSRAGATTEQSDGNPVQFAKRIDEEKFVQHFIDTLARSS